MSDLTVIYYTNNREVPAFAEKVQQTLLEAIGDLPLISVSQKPMDFGQNICVGDVGSSTQNTFRQLQIGAIAAKTTFIATAEADCLYPKEYFEFRPSVMSAICCAKPMWCLMAKKGAAVAFSPKRIGCIGASIMDREAAIVAIDQQLDEFGKWGDVDERDVRLKSIFKFMLPQYVRISVPIVTIKTEHGVHQRVPGYHGKRKAIPHWGDAYALMRRYGL